MKTSREEGEFFLAVMGAETEVESLFKQAITSQAALIPARCQRSETTSERRETNAPVEGFAASRPCRLAGNSLASASCLTASSLGLAQ